VKTNTGKDVQHDGSYVSECCFFEMVLIPDQMFPRCPKCLKLTTWAEADKRMAAVSLKKSRGSGEAA
jgi:hypothetical protein